MEVWEETVGTYGTQEDADSESKRGPVPTGINNLATICSKFQLQVPESIGLKYQIAIKLFNQPES